MKKSLHDALSRRFAQWPESVGEPVPLSEVDAAADALNVELPDDFREFVHCYGGGCVGSHCILGLRDFPFESDDPPYFTEQSLRFRAQLPEGYEQMVVICVDSSGNPIGFIPPDSTVFVFDHDFGGRHDLAPTFEDFLEDILR